MDTVRPTLTLSRPQQADMRVIAGLARGRYVCEIADDLGLPYARAAKMARRIGEAVGMDTLPGLVGMACRLGWLDDLRAEPRPEVHLTRREAQCLALTAMGLTSREIAARLRVDVTTANGALQRLRRRLSARSSAHAVALGYQLGLLAT